MRLGRSILLAVVAASLSTLLMVPRAADAQTSPDSLLLGTITVEGQPAPSLRTTITVTSGGVECGHTIPTGGTFSMLLSCPPGVAYVNVNGVPVAVIDVAPLVTVVVHLSIPAQGPPTPIATNTVPISPIAPGGTPRPPLAGNTPPAQEDVGATGGYVALAVAIVVLAVAGVLARRRLS